MRSTPRSLAVPEGWIRRALPAIAVAAAAALPFLPVPAWAWVSLRLFLQL